MRPSNAKKKAQLGIDPGTAAARLIRDLLWGYVKKEHPNCLRCGYPITRESFSIDHIRPWLDTDDPIGLFFDLTNIAYSHLACNVGDSRKPNAWTEQELTEMSDGQRQKILKSRQRVRARYHRLKNQKQL